MARKRREVEAVEEDAFHFFSRFFRVLHGVTGGNDAFRAPRDVRGPVGNDAVGAVRGVVASAVADDGVSGDIADREAGETTNGVTVRGEMADAGVPFGEAARVGDEVVPLQGGDTESLFHNDLRQTHHIAEEKNEAVAGKGRSAVGGCHIHHLTRLYGAEIIDLLHFSQPV